VGSRRASGRVLGGGAGIGKAHIVTALAEHTPPTWRCCSAAAWTSAWAACRTPGGRALADLVGRLGPGEAEAALGPGPHLGPALAVGGRTSFPRDGRFALRPCASWPWPGVARCS
jgi:hypothetical protein